MESKEKKTINKAPVKNKKTTTSKASTSSSTKVVKKQNKTEVKKTKVVEKSVEVEAKKHAISDEVLLDVRHLKQYFKFGTGVYKYNKAVHDVSFKINKGEVFGLVGESGCGKTTTGRSIIGLYDLTSGSVYFKGVRIAAGTRWNEKEIKFTKKRLDEDLRKLKEERAAKLNNFIEEDNLDVTNADDVQKIKDTKATINAKYDLLEKEKIDVATEIIDTQREKIRKAKFDHHYCNKEFIKQSVDKLNAKYKDFLEKIGKKPDIATLSPEDAATYKEYKKDLLIARHDKITLRMQMIFQDPIASLNPRMTVHDIIAEGLVINKIKDKKFIDERVNEMLQLVGLLPEHATRYPHEFSGGQRQRIGIARALIMNPDLIIADEPVSALDVSIQAQVINLLNDLRDKFGLTILFIAHNLSVVKYFCDKIAVMYYGNIVELASSEELFRNPLHPYTKSLLSAVPHPDPNYEKTRVRVIYNPKTDHNYTLAQPTLKEIIPGHFISCNDEEFIKYQKQLVK